MGRKLAARHASPGDLSCKSRSTSQHRSGPSERASRAYERGTAGAPTSRCYPTNDLAGVYAARWDVRLQPQCGWVRGQDRNHLSSNSLVGRPCLSTEFDLDVSALGLPRILHRL